MTNVTKILLIRCKSVYDFADDWSRLVSFRLFGGNDGSRGMNDRNCAIFSRDRQTKGRHLHSQAGGIPKENISSRQREASSSSSSTGAEFVVHKVVGRRRAGEGGAEEI